MFTPKTLPKTMMTRNVEAVDCLDFSGKTVYNDFRDDLVRDGVAVIKGAFGKEKAAAVVDEIHTYLEGFGLGYKRDDPSTHRDECMPLISEKGLMMHYAVSHEKFVWDVRADQGVRGAWETVYGTKDLIVSFDAINITVPNRSRPNARWAHQDQDPDCGGFRCLQGLVNLLPNGPDDGGLIVMKGAHLISEEFHRTFKDTPRKWQWTNEWFGLTDVQIDWLFEKGYKFEKINLEAGDLVLWESRVPHYNCSPSSSSSRMAVYCCYAPAFTANKEELLRKKDAFETFKGTSHWPQALQAMYRPAIRADGKPCPADRDRPFNPPVLNENDFKLTGIPYIATASA